MDIAERIKTYRTAKGYTVNKLANLSGISQSYLREIELGNRNPTVEILSLICDALEITLKDFFNDEISSTLSSDPLLQKIYHLNSEQRKTLLAFLNTL